MNRFYKKYFKNIAVTSKDILHTDDDKAFFFINDRYSIKPFDDALKSAAKTPALLLERAHYNLESTTSEAHRQDLNGRFNIVVMANSGDRESEEEAIDKAEIIAKKIIYKMRKDLKDIGLITIGSDSVKARFQIKNVTIDPIGPMLIKYYGVTIGFTWDCPLTVTSNDADWQ